MLGYQEGVITYDSRWGIIEDWLGEHLCTIISLFMLLNTAGTWIIALKLVGVL